MMTTQTISPETTAPAVRPKYPPVPSIQTLKPLIEPYIRPNTWGSIWQMVNSLVPYGLVLYLMWRSLAVSYWLTLGLSVLAAGFLIRVFILFHDCGHNSFFRSTKANRLVGFFLGLLVFTPGEQWWHSHAIHHATSGNLDKRGIGDVDTWTLREFAAAPRWKRLGYRLFRNPLILLGLGPIGVFLLGNRLPSPKFGLKETRSVWLTNLGLVLIAVGMSLLIGWKAYVLIQLPVIWLAGMGGIWMFYVQHQFEDMYWVSNGEWNYVASALQGASYYRLPKLLQWFTGNIGFHHIHHLNPRIPNYMLEPCYKSNQILQTCVRKIEFGKAFPYLFLAVWDEDYGRMIGFKEAEKRIQAGILSPN